MAHFLTTQDETFKDNDSLENFVKDHNIMSFDQKTELLAKGKIEFNVGDDTHITLELQRDDNATQPEATPTDEAAPAVEPGTPVADPAPVAPATATDTTTSAPEQSDAVKGEVTQ